MKKKWNKLEETEDILEHCFEVLNSIPVRDLRSDHMWIPSSDMLDSIVEARERVRRYMIRNHGWGNGNGH